MGAGARRLAPRPAAVPAPTLAAALLAGWWALATPGVDPAEPTSTVPLGVAVVAVATASAGAVVLGRWWQSRLGPAITAATVTLVAAGVWLAVPDTELAVGALGALAGVTAGSVATPQRSGEAPTGAGWAWAAPAALVTWGLLWGGRGRPAAVLGVSAAWALVVALPAVVVARRGVPRAPWAVVAGQLVVVAVASRWAARTTELPVAGLRAAATVVLAVALAAALVAGGRAADADGRHRAGE